MDENNMNQGFDPQKGYGQTPPDQGRPVPGPGQPQQGGFQQQNYQQGYPQQNFQQGYQQQNYQQGYNYVPQSKQGNSPGFIPLILLSVLQILCCNTITGIIAIILTFVADGAYRSGDIKGYESKKKIAIIVIIAGFVLTILLSIFTIAAGVSEIPEVADLVNGL